VVGQVTGRGLLDGVPTAYILSPELQVGLPIPAKAGQVNHWMVTGAQPDEVVLFAYGIQYGSTSIPICGGSYVEIQNAQLLGSAIADSEGVATLDKFVQGSVGDTAVIGQIVVLDAVFSLD